MLGWLRGLEPPTSGITIQRSNQLNYSHRRSADRAAGGALYVAAGALASSDVLRQLGGRLLSPAKLGGIDAMLPHPTGATRQGVVDLSLPLLRLRVLEDRHD